MATMKSTRTMVAALLLLSLLRSPPRAQRRLRPHELPLQQQDLLRPQLHLYRSNVVALLGSLATNASSSAVGFATAALGRAPDQVWGLALCRGDVVDATSCAYSDTDFLASPDAAAATVQFGVNTEINITSDPGRYVALAADLIGALAGWAARNSTRRYAAGVMTSGEGFATTNRNLQEGAGGSGDAATVIAIVLGVLLVVLASAFTIYIWRKARAKQHAGEDENAGSLLFDLTTLRRATDNFAEENKLGHGGFGAVYMLKGTPLETADPSLDWQQAAALQESEVLKCIHLGLLCVQEDPADRPTMLDILVMLHGHEASFAAP
ncbi:putative receptor-like protein kinase [Panicum miliaceum]|uniref:Receptor-like protein kinase n=1 Tax=Panicum miliaceum TaxID=4540 RepID=A0A3L6TMN6_PANMI|nr:putative receptor-like protein kinase [Panicum miliaceum]